LEANQRTMKQLIGALALIVSPINWIPNIIAVLG
jgi:uncharacterized membrane protein YkvA (DUF1232 family)